MKTITKPFVIETPSGLVAGFSASYQCVQSAGTADFAKLFKTEKAAHAFIGKYADAGYGLNSSTAKVRLA